MQELQAVAFVLCTMVFQLSNKVVTLHLNSSTAKTNLCIQGGTVCLFSFQTSMPHYESGQQAWYYYYFSIFTYLP